MVCEKHGIKVFAVVYSSWEQKKLPMPMQPKFTPHSSNNTHFSPHAKTLWRSSTSWQAKLERSKYSCGWKPLVLSQSLDKKTFILQDLLDMFDLNFQSKPWTVDPQNQTSLQLESHETCHQIRPPRGPPKVNRVTVSGRSTSTVLPCLPKFLIYIILYLFLKKQLPCFCWN